MLLPGPHADKRFVQLASEADYDVLLDHGVEIWNFQPSMLHAKVMTVDGLISNVGSANLNSRSVIWDEEVNLVVLEPALARVLDAQFEESGLTLTELHLIEESLGKSLIALYHARIKYPEAKLRGAS